jgi:hypothetical protein
MAHGDAREGKWRGNWWKEWVASTLHTTSEHGVSSITTAGAHTSAASSQLNWHPHQFKWTRPFCQKTISGFCACAITFQTQSTTQLPGNTLPTEKCTGTMTCNICPQPHNKWSGGISYKFFSAVHITAASVASHMASSSVGAGFFPGANWLWDDVNHLKVIWAKNEWSSTCTPPPPA